MSLCFLLFLSISSVSFFFFFCSTALSGVRAHTALIKALQLSVIHGEILFVCFFFLSPVSDGGQLFPPRPHVVGDALADLGTVVKVSLAHWPGLLARQLVAAENGGEKRGEEHRLDSHRLDPFLFPFSEPLL